MARSALRRGSSSTAGMSMADGLKVNSAAIRHLLKSPEVDRQVLALATKACDRANAWADQQPRSGRHADVPGPHFEVVSEPSKNRVRYTVRPRTGFGTWLVMDRPAEFMACVGRG